MSVTFEIPGQPFGKQRPRFNSRTRRTYTPAKTTEYQARVKAAGAQHCAQALTGPVRVEIMASFEPAPSWSRKRRQAALGTYHTQKPDFDNIAKAICDGLNGTAFTDDSQVAECSVVKVWGPVARTVVTIEPIGGEA